MKRENNLLTTLLSTLLVIVLVISLLLTKKGIVLSSNNINLLDISTSDIKETIDNLKKVTAEKRAEVDALKTRVSSLTSDTIGTETSIDKVYPVGSIFISTSLSSAAAVQNALGGTWISYGDGKLLRSATSGVGDTHTATGSVTLAVGNLPSHTHTMAHTHTYTAKGSNSYNTSNVNTGGISANHTHTLGSRTVNSSSAGNHYHLSNQHTYLMYHTTASPELASGGLCGGGLWSGMAMKLRGDYTSSAAGSHSHAMSLAAVNTGSSDAVNTHTHTVSAATVKSAIGTITFSGNNGNVGAATGNTTAYGQSSPTAISTVDPYITVYMYKRTA